MISKSQQPRRCYVYITLPGETKPVTAGRYELAPIARAFRLGASSMAGAIWPEPKRSRSIRWSSSSLRACTRRFSSTESSVRCAMLRQTIGVVWSSSAPLARDHSGRWTICCNRPTTARVLSASASMKSHRRRCASSTRPWTWRSFNPSPLRSSRIKILCAVRKPSRCKSCCSAAHRWVARVPRPWSRTAKAVGRQVQPARRQLE